MHKKIILLYAAFLFLHGYLSEAVSSDPFDIVINELMVRPSPQIGLPDAEYIELFNRSANPVNLQNWTIKTGTRSKILPGHVMMPESYLIVTHEKNTDLLSTFGNVAGLPGFSVLAMGGQTVVLKDDKDNVISAVSYSDKWYGSSLKASGGWSLEQIDPFNPCGGSGNWSASESSTGGTPGAPNSIRRNNPDKEPPALVRASLQQAGLVRLHFSEPMHPQSGWSPGDYAAAGYGPPLSAMPADPLFEEVDLLFPQLFEEGTDYTLVIKGNLYDCAGNFLDGNTSEVLFKIPESPKTGDIIINEILFNPFPGGANFVELINISGSVFDLKQVILAGMTEGVPDPAYIIAPGGYLLFPDEYIVLTTDAEAVKSHYYSPKPWSFVNMDRMPPMNNKNGRVIIAGLQMNIIDDMQYTSDMHSPLLTNVKGVSLERINFSRPASDRTNWLSASENSGFATPGYKNSQFSEFTGITEKILSIDPKIFSPDNSGYNDIVNIKYELDKPGYTGNITIFDSQGRPVRRLVRNELLGTSGIYSWDGRNDAGHQSRLGIYLVFMELLHPDGDIRRSGETVVLGGRFRK